MSKAKKKPKARKKNAPTKAQLKKRAAERRRAKTRPPTLKEKNEFLSGEVKRLRAELEQRKTNPRRPPRAWWNRCLASVSAQRHARDPAAVCGASWWGKTSDERRRVVERLERGSALDKRKAIALARAERNRHVRGSRRANSPKGRRGKASSGRRDNPRRELFALAYKEQKPGDDRPYIYEHKFSKPRPTLAFRGGGIQAKGGRWFTSRGWIHD